VKVLLTADTVGGVWTYALELADALAARDVNVSLAAMGASLLPDQRAELRTSQVESAFVSECALEWMEDPWADVERAGRWLLGVAEEVEPDVVHLSSYSHGALPWGVPVVVTGHSDVLSWHEAVRGRPAAAEWARYRAAVEAGLAAADLLVAPTQAMLDELVRLYRHDRATMVIANGIGGEAQHRPKDELVLGAGRLWDEAKNVQALAAVAPRLPWPVEVAGEGAVGDSVRPLGRLTRERLGELLAAAAIFAEPARYEPFGLAALEAARAGCALVLGDIPSLREVWGDAALFVGPDDHDALERALRRLIEDSDLRASFGDRARDRASAYTAARMADGYLAAYEAVLRKEPVPA
jgi:glycogen(starch) synthase